MRCDRTDQMRKLNDADTLAITLNPTTLPLSEASVPSWDLLLQISGFDRVCSSLAVWS